MMTNPVSSHIPVLVVDDAKDIRELFRLILEDAGYPVLEARDGVQALEFLHAHPAPLVVLTNHHMPRLNGPGLLRRVLREPALVVGHAYVYMTASTRDVPPALQALLDSLHAQALFKPITAHALIAAIGVAAEQLRTTAGEVVGRDAESDGTATPH